MGSDVDVALCCGPQKKVAFTWEMIVCYGVPTVGRKRKVRGPHGGPEKESSPGRTDLVLAGIEVDLDVAQPPEGLFCVHKPTQARVANFIDRNGSDCFFPIAKKRLDAG